MSIQGIILIDLIGIGLIVLILNLVRTHALHVGYAAIWLVTVVVLMTIISVPQLMSAVTVTVGATYPASALSLLAFIFIFIMLVVFSVQLTVLSTRQVKLIQALAVHELQPAPSGALDDRSGIAPTEVEPAAHPPSNG
jgi:hypothetical protein